MENNTGNEFYQKFAKAKDVCTEAYRYYDEADAIEAKYRAVAMETLEKVYKKTKWRWIWILPVLMFVFWLLVQDTVQGLLLIIAVPAALAGGVFVWSRIVGAMTKVAQDAEMKKYQPMLDKINANISAGNRVLEENMEAVAFIPQEIRFPQSAAYLMKLAEENRADSLSAYMNLLDKQIARWKEEAAINQKLQVARDRAEQSRVDSINSAIALGVNVARIGGRATF